MCNIELEQVLEFIEGSQLNEDRVAKKLNRMVRISQSKRIWEQKLEKARNAEKQLMGGKTRLEAEIAQVIRNRDHMQWKINRDIPSDKARMRYAIQVMKGAGGGGEKPFEEALENLIVAEEELKETLPSFGVRLNQLGQRMTQFEEEIKMFKQSELVAEKIIEIIQLQWMQWKS